MGSGQSLRISGLGTPAALVRTGGTVVSTTALMAHLCSKPTSLRGLTWPPCTHPPSVPAGQLTDSGARGAGAGSHRGQGWLLQQVKPVFLTSGRAI